MPISDSIPLSEAYRAILTSLVDAQIAAAAHQARRFAAAAKDPLLAALPQRYLAVERGELSFDFVLSDLGVSAPPGEDGSRGRPEAEPISSEHLAELRAGASDAARVALDELLRGHREQTDRRSRSLPSPRVLLDRPSLEAVPRDEIHTAKLVVRFDPRPATATTAVVEASDLDPSSL